MRHLETCSPVKCINQKETSKLQVKPFPTIPVRTLKPLNCQDFLIRSVHHQQPDHTNRGDMINPTETTNCNKPKQAKNTLLHNYTLQIRHAHIHTKAVKLGASTWRQLGNAKPSISNLKLTSSVQNFQENYK